METLRAEHQRLEKKGNLKKAVDDVQKTIDLLVAARDAVSAGMEALRCCINSQTTKSVELTYHYRPNRSLYDSGQA